MKEYWLDILCTTILLIGLFFYVQQEQPSYIDIELYDSENNAIQPKEPALIHFWATWSKPSHRDIQVLQRFSKRHPDIQLIGVHSETELVQDINELKLEMGMYYSLSHSPNFPSSIPLTIILHNGEQQIIRESVQYERLMEIFNREY